MESAIRYDFSFPPKSNSNNNNTNQINSFISNTPVTTGAHVHHQHHQQLAHNQQTHTIHNVRHSNHGNFNYNNQHSVSNGIGLSKSASTSLLSCNTNNISNNNINNNKNNSFLKLNNNNNYCFNCNNCTNSVCNSNNLNKNPVTTVQKVLNNQAVNQHNVHYSSNNHYQVNKTSPYAGLLQQNHHNFIAPLQTPATPKDSNCSFSKFFVSFYFLI